MKVCIGGKNNIAVNVCSYFKNNYTEHELYVIPNRGDDGIDGFQRSLKKYAIDNNIPIVSLADVYIWDDLIFLSVEFDRIIKPERFASKKLYNIHFSLLPKYKGCHTTAMPILNGENIGGVTFHIIEKGIDTGDIIDQEKTIISNDDTCRSLYMKYMALGYEVIKRNIDNVLDENVISYPQPIANSTYYSRNEIDYSDIRINFNRTAAQVECQFRAYSFRDFQLPKFQNVEIAYAKITTHKSNDTPGTIVDESKRYFRVSTIDYDILLYKDIFPELIEMVSKGDIDALKNIKDLRKYINQQETTHGWTLLMIAAYHNHYEIAKYLMKIGSNINAINYKGTSVIMYAKDGMLNTGDNRLFYTLLEKGANPFAKDYSGKNLFAYINDDLRSQIFTSI